MKESILESIKKQVGVESECEAFDNELIIHINSVLAVLIQEGIGPISGFEIYSNEETWEDFLGADIRLKSLAKSFVGSKVKLIFDPPMSSTATEVLKEVIKEYETRLYMEKNPINTFEGDANE